MSKILSNSSVETRSPSTLGRKAASGAAWLTLETVFGQGASLVVFSVMAHYLTPRDFGLVSISFVFIYSSKFILLDQISTAIMRKADGTDLDYTTAFWITVGISGFVFLAIQALSLFADHIFHAAGLGVVMRAMSVILLVMGFSRPQESWLERQFFFRTLAIRSIVGIIAGGIVGVTAAVHHFGVWSLVIQQLTTSILAFGLLCFTCPWRPSFAFSSATAAEIMPILRKAGSANALTTLNDNCDTLLIAFAYGTASAGIYAVGKRLMLAMQLVAAQPVNGVALPLMAEVQNDLPRLRAVLLKAVSLVIVSCAALFVGAAAVSHDAVLLFFGPKWAASGPVVSCLAISGLCAILVRFNNTMFLIRGRTEWTLYLTGLYGVLALLFFVLLKLAGFKILALPFVLPWAIVLPISVSLLLRISDIPAATWLRAVMPPLSAALIMFLAVRIVSSNLQMMSLPFRLAASIICGMFVYTLAILLTSKQTALLISTMMKTNFKRSRQER